MKIGVRASPTEVVYCVLDSSECSIVTVDKIVIPKSLDVPEQLKHVRLNLLDILHEYEITHAGIRIFEPTARKIYIDRIQIEGVIQEAFASSSVKDYYVGQISSISARADIKRSDFKKIIDGDLDFPRIDNWNDFNKNEREAVLCALGA